MQHDGRLRPTRLLALVALLAPVTAAQVPMTMYLPALYAKVHGLSLAAIGAVFLIGRLWDSFSDPLVGLLSDRTRTRWGRRRPWIAAGSLLFALATVAVFMPQWHSTPWTLGVSLVVFYLGWTMIQIPLYAWMGEISGHYHERTRIVTYGQVVVSVSLLLILLLPVLVDRIEPGADALKLVLMGGFILVVLLPTAWASLAVNGEPPPPPPGPRASFVESVRAVFGSGLLMRVLASDLAVTFGQGVRGSLLLFFVASYMGRPEVAGLLFLVQTLLGILAGPVWLRVGYRIGKHRAVVLAECLQVAINLGLLLVQPGGLPLLLALTVAQGLTQGVGNLMLRAIVADVADRERLATGQDRTALMYSVFSLSGKLGTALAVGLALPLVGWLGFDPRGANDAQALAHLKWVFALGPALGHALSALVLFNFPLGPRQHEQIQAELRRREAAISTSGESHGV